jgi:hypothetical protein
MYIAKTLIKIKNKGFAVTNTAISPVYQGKESGLRLTLQTHNHLSNLITTLKGTKSRKRKKKTDSRGGIKAPYPAKLSFRGAITLRVQPYAHQMVISGKHRICKQIA